MNSIEIIYNNSVDEVTEVSNDEVPEMANDEMAELTSTGGTNDMFDDNDHMDMDQNSGF